MKKVKLRTFDGIAFTSFLILPTLFSTGLGTITEQNKMAAWIALLITTGIMLCLFLLVSSLMRKYEGKNIMEITANVMGKSFSCLYGIALSLYFCYFTGVHIREAAEILKSYGFNMTPIYILVILMILAAVAMNFFGGQAMIKSAGFFFIFTLLGIVFVILLGINRYNADNLVPILGNGIPDLLKNGLLMTSMFDGVLILLLFAPEFPSVAKMKKAGVLSIVLSAAAFILLCVCCVMMFSSKIAASLMSGFLEMGKSSYYNHFFYRFESILLFVLIFSSLLLASIGLYVSKESLVRSCGFKPSKLLIVLCALPVCAAALIPGTIYDLIKLYLPVISRYSVFFMAGFPLLVLIISRIKKVTKLEKS